MLLNYPQTSGPDQNVLELILVTRRTEKHYNEA